MSSVYITAAIVWNVNNVIIFQNSEQLIIGSANEEHKENWSNVKKNKATERKSNGDSTGYRKLLWKYKLCIYISKLPK